MHTNISNNVIYAGPPSPAPLTPEGAAAVQEVARALAATAQAAERLADALCGVPRNFHGTGINLSNTPQPDTAPKPTSPEPEPR